SGPGYICETSRMRTGEAYCSARAIRRSLLRCFVLLRGEDVREAVHGCVAGTERRKVPALLDRREDRGRVVLGVVDDLVASEERRDDERRDPRPGAPLVVRAGRPTLAGRRHVIPL